MKILKLSLFLVIVGFFLFTSQAEAHRLNAGGCVGYGSKSENVDFQVNVYYRLPTLPLRIGGDVGFSNPETDLTEIESNLNVHFMVVDSDLLSCIPSQG